MINKLLKTIIIFSLSIFVFGVFSVSKMPTARAYFIIKSGCSADSQSNNTAADTDCRWRHDDHAINSGSVICTDKKEYPNNANPYKDFTSGNVGVLVTCNQPTLQYYLDAFLSENLTLIMFIALIMIVASGIQYMLSGFSPEAAKLAKQRIIGILVGILFFLLIRLLLNQISPGIGLPSAFDKAPTRLSMSTQ